MKASRYMPLFAALALFGGAPQDQPEVSSQQAPAATPPVCESCPNIIGVYLADRVMNKSDVQAREAAATEFKKCLPPAAVTLGTIIFYSELAIAANHQNTQRVVNTLADGGAAYARQPEHRHGLSRLLSARRLRFRISKAGACPGRRSLCPGQLRHQRSGPQARNRSGFGIGSGRQRGPAWQLDFADRRRQARRSVRLGSISQDGAESAYFETTSQGPPPLRATSIEVRDNGVGSEFAKQPLPF